MSKNFKNSLTPVSILVGVIGAVIVTASSFYIVLKFGALPWPTIMVTMISMSVLGIFGRKDTGEITITHTIMSAGSMVAGGVAFTMPGYLILGGKLHSINKSVFLTTVLIGSILGAILSFIFRKKLIETDKLEFPVGEAAYNLVKSGKNKKRAKFVTVGTIFSTAVAILRDYTSQKGKVPIIPTIYSIKNGLLSFYISPLLLGVGYILGFMNTFIWFLGGAVTYLIAKPLSGYYNIKDFDIIKNSFGMGFVIGIGVSVILKIIIDTKRANKFKRIKNNSSNMKIILFLFSVAGIILISFIYKLPVFLSFVLIVICILCTVIAGYTTGKTGINPMEIYAIISILVISFLNVLLNGLNIGGVKFSTNINLLTLFLLSCIVSVACGLAGDILNDFKSGFKMKVSPTEQFIGELIGAVVSSFVVTFLFFIFFDIYKNIGPQENSELIVLQASIVASVIKGIPFIHIFWIGLTIGFILNILNIPVLTFGIGIYLPLYLTLPVFIGGMVNFISSRISEKFSSDMLLFSNGLMSGEAIVGVILSILVYIKIFI